MKKSMINIYIISIVVLVTCYLIREIDATEYVVINTVPNTPGGQVFEKEIGEKFTKKMMPIMKRIIFKIFEQNTPAERRSVPVVNVYISDFKGYAYKNDYNINISAPALSEFYYPRNKSKWYFTMVLIHEMAHVYQWHGNFGAPRGLTEGTADYVRVKSGYYDKDKFTKPGAGKKWDEGYGVTERFLEYCDSLLEGFTAKLNKKMRYKYSDSYWVELLGKPVDQLWREYKAKYVNLQSQEEDEEEEYFNIGAFPAGLEYYEDFQY